MAYRLYSFVNHLYMSPIQWGIQTAHCVSTMMNNAAETKDEDPLSYAAVHKWAAQEPTIIVCQGGNAAMLTDLYVKLVPLAARLGHPIVKFHEDEQSLGGVITAVAVLVPDFLYNCQVVEYDRTTNLPRFKRPVPVDALDVDHPQYYTFTQEEYEFLSTVKTARLA